MLEIKLLMGGCICIGNEVKNNEGCVVSGSLNLVIWFNFGGVRG